jgi:hypothetical protein
MQKSRVTIEKMPDFTKRRASSTEAQMERMLIAPAPPPTSPHSLPIFYLELQSFT